MARYTGPVCRLCRREGMKLFLKGNRCLSAKCAVDKRKGAPGMTPKKRGKISEYGIQLREKQKVKRIYGVLERQFSKYFQMASRKKGITGFTLLKFLETRLDNVVYRLSFAASRAEARQLVKHAHFAVNGKRVDIPSYQMKTNDTISVLEKSKQLEVIRNNLKNLSRAKVPAWLTVDPDSLTGKVVNVPQREDIELKIEENLIVELYSK